MNTRFNRYWSFYKTHQTWVQLGIFITALTLMYVFIPGVRYGRMRSDLTTPRDTSSNRSTTQKLDCKNADSEAFTNQFMNEIAEHEKAVLGSDQLAWKRFETWIQGIPCIDGAYAEGIMAVWENGITQNWPLFLSYYRTPEAEKPRLKLMVEAIYNADGNDVIEERSGKALREIFAQNCPPEFQDLCSKKPSRPKN